ncbi:MAG: phosphate signaling complex PhoU family protein [Fusobacteriaceae bacterium]
MKNLKESLFMMDKNYLEMLKYLNRAIDLNIEALENKEVKASVIGESIITENYLNNMEVNIKEEAIIIIARFQPAAKDLRKLVMYIDSVRVIERMGDLLKGCLGVIKKIEENKVLVTISLNEIILPVLEKIKIIYESYIYAFTQSDVNLLYPLLLSDEEIDKVISCNNDYIIELMKKDIEVIESGTLLLLLDKKYERVSDHINHLVKNLIYILKGDNIRKNELTENLN